MQVEDLGAAYAEHRDKATEMLCYLGASRKYGFPVVCSLMDKSNQEQIAWAARYLLFVCGIEIETRSLPNSAFEAFVLQPDNALGMDAKDLLAMARGNTDQLDRT